jgi:hypothetical protein
VDVEILIFMYLQDVEEELRASDWDSEACGGRGVTCDWRGLGAAFVMDDTYLQISN